MFDVELVERGKHHPGKIPTDKYDNIGKTVGLLVSIYHRLYSIGKFVILGSSFCVFQRITEVIIFFVSSVIKKRRYWPTLIPDDAIDKQSSNKEVGGTDSLKGKIDNHHYNIFSTLDRKVIQFRRFVHTLSSKSQVRTR